MRAGESPRAILIPSRCNPDSDLISKPNLIPGPCPNPGARLTLELDRARLY